jgi:phosphoglycerate dehydrogenase-like enzyme
LTPPAIHIGPDQHEAIAQAVREGGGEPAPLAEAVAVVWTAGAQDFPELPGSVRWVQLPSAGVETWMDRIQAAPDGVVFTSAAGAYATDVAEHAVALLLAGVRGFARYARTRTWEPQDDRLLEGSSVAVVGAGGIGRAAIERLAPFDVEIVAVTRRGIDVPGAHRTLAADGLPGVWSSCDHFIVAAPATGSTRHLVGAEQLAEMKPHSWIVNIARGSLIDTDALVEALQAERIGGAALDVTDPEPLPDGHPLWESPRAIITPHVANPPSAQFRKLAERVTENVARFVTGAELLAPIEKDRGY